MSKMSWQRLLYETILKDLGSRQRDYLGVPATVSRDFPGCNS